MQLQHLLQHFFLRAAGRRCRRGKGEAPHQVAAEGQHLVHDVDHLAAVAEQVAHVDQPVAVLEPLLDHVVDGGKAAEVAVRTNHPEAAGGGQCFRTGQDDSWGSLSWHLEIRGAGGWRASRKTRMRGREYYVGLRFDRCRAGGQANPPRFHFMRTPGALRCIQAKKRGAGAPQFNHTDRSTFPVSAVAQAARRTVSNRSVADSSSICSIAANSRVRRASADW